jgi:hypothetical protein
VWERKTALPREPRVAKPEGLPTGTRRQALQAWAELMRALAQSPEASDRELAQSINRYLLRMPAVQAIAKYQAGQRELPGMDRQQTVALPTQQRRGPEMER